MRYKDFAILLNNELELRNETPTINAGEFYVNGTPVREAADEIQKRRKQAIAEAVKHRQG